MTSSDERREVAERLRAAAKTKSGSADYLWNRLEIAVNGWKFGDVIDESYVFDNDVLSRLAGLIDPTCENTKRRTEIYDSSFRCSACGYETLTYDNSDCDPWTFAYCPECGARVVDDDNE